MKKTKCLAGVLLAGAVILCGVWGFSRHDKPTGIPAATETDREIYLFTQGWKGEPDPDERTVIVPDAADAVFAPYAALQAQQGLPVADFAGKTAQVYTYRLYQSELYAELLCADGELIGAMCYDPAAPEMLSIQGKQNAGA